MTEVLKILSDTSIRPTLATVNSTYRRLQNSSAENAKRFQLIIAKTSDVGRILESDILGIAAMDCNGGNAKGFVGYKYPTYACWCTTNRKNPPCRIVVKINNSFQVACFSYIRVSPAIQRLRGDMH